MWDPVDCGKCNVHIHVQVKVYMYCTCMCTGTVLRQQNFTVHRSSNV